jgi:hypothetical protein
MYICVCVHCHLGWRTLVLKCDKNNYDCVCICNMPVNRAPEVCMYVCMHADM